MVFLPLSLSVFACFDCWLCHRPHWQTSFERYCWQGIFKCSSTVRLVMSDILVTSLPVWLERSYCLLFSLNNLPHNLVTQGGVCRAVCVGQHGYWLCFDQLIPICSSCLFSVNPWPPSQLWFRLTICSYVIDRENWPPKSLSLLFSLRPPPNFTSFLTWCILSVWILKSLPYAVDLDKN